MVLWGLAIWWVVIWGLDIWRLDNWGLGNWELDIWGLDIWRLDIWGLVGIVWNCGKGVWNCWGEKPCWLKFWRGPCMGRSCDDGCMGEPWKGTPWNWGFWNGIPCMGCCIPYICCWGAKLAGYWIGICWAGACSASTLGAKKLVYLTDWNHTLWPRPLAINVNTSKTNE